MPLQVTIIVNPSNTEAGSFDIYQFIYDSNGDPQADPFLLESNVPISSLIDPGYIVIVDENAYGIRLVSNNDRGFDCEVTSIDEFFSNIKIVNNFPPLYGNINITGAAFGGYSLTPPPPQNASPYYYRIDTGTTVEDTASVDINNESINTLSYVLTIRDSESPTSFIYSRTIPPSTGVTINVDNTFLSSDRQYIISLDTYMLPSKTPSLTPSKTPSLTPSITITPSLTPSITITPTITPSLTPSKTPSLTPGETPSLTPSLTPSKTPSLTPGETPSITPSETPSITPSETPSLTPSETPSLTPSETPSITPSETPTPTLTPSETPTPSMPNGEFIMDPAYLVQFDNMLGSGLPSFSFPVTVGNTTLYYTGTISSQTITIYVSGTLTSPNRYVNLYVGGISIDRQAASGSPLSFVFPSTTAPTQIAFRLEL